MLKLFTFINFAFFVLLSLPLGAAVPQERHIKLQGNAELEAPADIAIVRLQVESKSILSIDAKKSIDKSVNQVIAGLKHFSISEDDLIASNINLRPQYQYSKNQQRELVAYQASRSLTATLNDLSRLDEFLNFALKAGITQIQGIELASSQSNKLKQEALNLAIENAKKQGNSLAAGFSARLGKIYSINTVASNDYARFGSNKMLESIQMTRMADASAEPGQYLHENIVFSASIEAVFLLEDLE